MSEKLHYATVRRDAHSAAFDGQYEALREFFKGAYGQDYNGDERLVKKLQESDTCLALYRGDDMVAAALAGLGRITTIGTTPNLNTLHGHDETVPSRFGVMVRLLQHAKATEGVEWISVGVAYERMNGAVALAGLSRVQCGRKITALLDSVNETDRYKISTMQDSRVIVKSSYAQNVYAKEGCQHNDAAECGTK